MSLEWDLDFAENQKCQNQVLMKIPTDTFPNKIFHLLTFTGEKNPKKQKTLLFKISSTTLILWYWEFSVAK